MRKVKFRAKFINKDRTFPEDRWVYGSYLEHIGTIQDEYQDFDVEVNTLGQFTRLVDKNGTEIYEGDIVKFNNQTGKIVFEYGSFGVGIEEGIDYERLENFTRENLDNSFDGTFNDNFLPLFEIYYNLNNVDGYIDEVEVIGNIYDNPELLEVSNE